MRISRPRIGLALVGASFLCLSAWWVAAELRAFRAEVERELEVAASEARGRLRWTIAELEGALAEGEGARLDRDGRFLVPPEPRALAALELLPGSDEEGRWLLLLAEQNEGAGGDALEAERVYAAACSSERTRLCRALAHQRLAAILRRRGASSRASEESAAFLGLLEGAERECREALLERALAAVPDPELVPNLLICLGGPDEPIALGLLASAGAAEASGLPERRAELAWMEGVRPLVPELLERERGLACTEDALLAWRRAPDGSTRIERASLPAWPAGTSLRRPGEPAPTESGPARYVPVPELPPGHAILASLAAEEVGRRRRAHLLRTLLALAAPAGLGLFALIATWRGLLAERAAAARESAFVARVGHDLRTPLSVIRMYAETLAAGRVDERGQEREFARTIAGEAARLGEMVGSVLELARLEEHERLKLRPIRLERLVEETVRSQRLLYEAAGMELRAELPREGLEWEGDEDTLRGALGNLLENCLHHARSGGSAEVVLRASAAQIELSVLDRGPGFEPELAERAFERFVRGARATSRGAGLGLALVREVAEAHGGTVELRAREGGGAELCLRLPRSGKARA